MEYYSSPLSTTVRGGLPQMMAFFTTPVFFWRPVGVMEIKVICPNANCPAPPGSFLSKHGYGNIARTVCGLRYQYTLLTERLICSSCMKVRQGSRGEDEQSQLQYQWHAYSPAIIMNLPQAVSSMFPAVLCGKRAIDKNVITLLNDRLNSVSMAKVHRIVTQGHDEWYAQRRELYQTVLYQAHAASTAADSQKSILPFIKKAGTYTPPLPQTLPIPRQFHLHGQTGSTADQSQSLIFLRQKSQRWAVSGHRLCH